MKISNLDLWNRGLANNTDAYGHAIYTLSLIHI